MKLQVMRGQALADWYYTELTEAFPATERKPLEEILFLCQEGRYEPLGLYEGDILLGYATLWRAPEEHWVLLDYLGVTVARRGCGLGERLLGLLRQRVTEGGILAEAESPVHGDSEEENALRRRRIAFYQRCGLVPLYEMATCGMRFLTLLLGSPPKHLEDVMVAHRTIYGDGRSDVRIPLPAGEEPQPPHWMINGR